MGKTIFFLTKRRKNVRGTRAYWCIVPSRPASRRPSVPSRPVPPSFHFCCPVPSRGGTGRDGTVLVPHPAELWDESHGMFLWSTAITWIVRSGFEMPSLHIAEPRVTWPSEVVEEAQPFDIDENDGCTMIDNWVYMFDTVRWSREYFPGLYYSQAKQKSVQSMLMLPFLLVTENTSCADLSTQSQWFSLGTDSI